MLKLTAALCVVAAVAVTANVASAAEATGFSFASIGDWGCVPIGGWHEQDQLTVATQFAQAAAEINAKFVLNTGDNFYYCGIESQYDSWWNTTFESVYNQKSLMVPWYNTLGNHDYGYPTSVDNQINYKSPNANRWILPARYYYKRLMFPGKTNISLIVLDATPCMSSYRSSDPSGWDPCGSVIPGCPGCTFHQNVIAQSCSQQLAWYQQTMARIPQGDWKIVMNHAPATDVDVEDFVAVYQQYKVDMYINGHVHLMAHYQVDNAGTYITTGAGCMVRIWSDAEDNKKTNNGGKQRRGQKHAAANNNSSKKILREVEPGDELVNIRRDKRASKLGQTSCPRSSKSPHTCQLIYQKTVAGYSTHTFSADYQQLYTYIYKYDGTLLHSLSVQKGTGGGSGSGPVPTPPSSSSSGSGSGASSSTSGTCCVHDSGSACAPGEVCCSDAGNPYDKYYCDKWGSAKNCVWESSVSKCIVSGGKH